MCVWHLMGGHRTGRNTQREINKAESVPAMLAAVRACVAEVFDATEARDVWEGTARRLYRI